MALEVELDKKKLEFTDDKGMFQGGMKKRFAGRFRDRVEDLTAGTKKFNEQAIKIQSGDPNASPSPDGDSLSAKKDSKFSYKQKSELSEDLREQENLTKKAGYNMYDKNRADNPNFVPNVVADNDGAEWEVPAYSEEFSYARSFALDFNPSDKNQVTEMQRRLNNAGFKGADGKPLVIDGVLGDNTVTALRAMQSEIVC